MIFHNPSCSKSRQTLGILQDGGVAPEIVLYKEAPPDRATVEMIVDRIDVEPSKLVRRDPDAARVTCNAAVGGPLFAKGPASIPVRR